MTGPLPLLGLRAYAEIGRRGSVKAAAEAMGVTPGAVSQQLKLLEERLGLALFVRDRRGIRLTEAGARAHPVVQRGFDQLAEALDLLAAEGRRETLTVSTAPSFAASWLVPRLGRFTARHPGIEVRVEATTALADLGRVDVVLRHGLGRWPGLVSEPLLAPRLLPVASPELLRRGPPVAGPADCLAYPLLQDGDRADWRLWLAAQGIEDPRAERGPAFDSDLLLVRAAIAGQGLALVRDLYVAEEIAAGRLALVLDRPWPTRFAYYVAARPAVWRTPKLAAFRAWLAEEVRGAEDGAAEAGGGNA
ncbi:LysR family transcriptional regulator [Inquilinus limosus]|uniref:LysR substrate-binding domain-containing protein n=1 Tax=Inquilinus limosus TaxID=171674 RepID=UPI003F14760A